ncbi:MAG TPA: hypothetical protein VD886_18550 [Herpetosiphonaceae bacterium]|nr:hypothetical protein [Herpetosiphonaceae bacterium]
MTHPALPPIRVAPGGRYFETADGQPFLLIGANDAISWAGLAGLYRRRDVDGAAAYLADLAAHGITVLRLMLEYCQEDGWYFEQPAGTPDPAMLQYWDDLFGLCERLGLRVLLAPWDNFWMARRWQQHPYNRRNGGPADSPAAFFGDDATIAATIRRLELVIERWGGSGVIAAWDLFNEIDPFWGGDAGHQASVIGQLSAAIRAHERHCWGWSRPQTLSIFGPEPNDAYGELIFRHPALDFATTHIYYQGSIDFPEDTVAPAVAMARWVRHGLSHVPPGRPFTDTEHGPIHLFNDHERMLDEDFDDEYERHLMWAHLASGGAGSGMRWPARNPHVLTAGMKRALKSLADFCQLIDWRHFASRNAGQDVSVATPGVLAFACRDDRQAVIWLLRGKPAGNPPGRLPRRAGLTGVELSLAGLRPGRYAVTPWDTLAGRPLPALEAVADDRLRLGIPCPENDLALAVRRIE